MGTNTQSRAEYISSFFWWSCLPQMYAYFLAPIFSSAPISRLFLLALLIVTSSITIFLTQKHSRTRTDFEIHSTLVFAVGSYCVLAYEKYLPFLTHLTTIIALLSCVVFSIRLYSGLSKTASKKRRRFRHIRTIVLSCRTICAACFIPLLVVIFVITLRGGIIFNAPPNEVQKEYSEYDRMNILLSLEQSHWDNLSKPERLQILQSAADLKMRDAGIPHKITVSAVILPNNSRGNYSQSDHRISINASLLSGNSYEAYETLLQGCYYAYLYYVTNLDPFIKA